MGGTRRTAVTVTGWEAGAGSLEKTARAVACTHAQQGGATQRAVTTERGPEGSGDMLPCEPFTSNVIEGAPSP